MVDEAMPLEKMVEDGDDNTMRMAPLLVGNSKEEQAQILIEMLRAEELSDRITAAHQLTKIAGVIGFVRTRKELLPYLVESVDDDDEVLIALAEGLGKLVPFVGGNSFAHSLLPLLEMLLTTGKVFLFVWAINLSILMVSFLNEFSFGLLFLG